MISRTFVLWVVALFVFQGGVSVGHGQDSPPKAAHPQSVSLGDAARSARAEKKTPAKPAKVFTNDDMKRLNDTPSPTKNRSAKKTAGAVTHQK